MAPVSLLICYSVRKNVYTPSKFEIRRYVISDRHVENSVKCVCVYNIEMQQSMCDFYGLSPDVRNPPEITSHVISKLDGVYNM